MVLERGELKPDKRRRLEGCLSRFYSVEWVFSILESAKLIFYSTGLGSKKLFFRFWSVFIHKQMLCSSEINWTLVVFLWNSRIFAERASNLLLGRSFWPNLEFIYTYTRAESVKRYIPPEVLNISRKDFVCSTTVASKSLFIIVNSPFQLRLAKQSPFWR